MKIVFLDRKTIGEDIDLSGFNRFGEVIIYDFSKPEEVPARVEDADIIILNKVPINEKTIGTAKNLKLVCVTATGVNNLDLDYLAAKNIEWRNVAGYSTQTVTQHTFALLFYLFENLAYYDNYVKTDGYTRDFMFTHFEKRFGELYGKTYGIIGLGAIGRQVASVAKAFGCNVQYYSTSGKNHDSEYKEVSFDELLATSDIISIHAPLNDATNNLINKEALSKMKKSAILLNLGRGPIVNEKDLADALENDVIRAAGLDVLSVEPIEESNPLLRIKDSTKLLITPHIAWASIEARTRLMKIIEDHIAKFLSVA
ncbi:MAG: D-2-hydroxyacid dehydrogenase [Butyrivibrio sp.]|uniref:D-2-hydroxyacid dehydrogenase n=1 Tax=Butyrivibrio sp. TaxID=28121 RepID=UPI0025EE5D6B|nr:D-2-hydroxyacid dehydrogenase [Butyrivibrio sp.]MCR5771657.1 D-2-hydroxyacid dehydrogenase [Butyrivibrio sp.]